jgi:ribosomal protein S18 acetylase RimI-like enzyme
MLKIEKISENNKQPFLASLKSDIVRHVFAVYDIQNEPSRTTTYAAFENRDLKGYILIYLGADVPSVVLECESSVAEELTEYAPKNNFIVHTSLDLVTAVQHRFPSEKHYIEDWMLVRRSEARFYKSELVRRLHNDDDAEKLAGLLSTRQDRPKRAAKRYFDWISKMPIFGVLVRGKLLSYAGSFLQLPQVWMIGGVFTHPEHRSKGYATLAVSAVTEEALKNSEAAALFVRSDNYPAVKSYRKIGYKKIGEKAWIDVGTGLRP